MKSKYRRGKSLAINVFNVIVVESEMIARAMKHDAANYHSGVTVDHGFNAGYKTIGIIPSIRHSEK
jgi:hypothetical protein